MMMMVIMIIIIIIIIIINLCRAVLHFHHLNKGTTKNQRKALDTTTVLRSADGVSDFPNMQ